jgi:nitroreductase
MNEIIKNIMSRRSIRSFKPQQLKDDELKTIIDAGRYAPTGMNTQPWHFTVIQNKDWLNRFNQACKAFFTNIGNEMFIERYKDENYSIFYNAPTLIVVSGNEKALTVQADCHIALGYMFLAAESLGIGSCWINAAVSVLSSKEGIAIREELNLPEGHLIFGSGAFGYKAVNPPAPPRKEDVVSYIR